MAAGRRLLGKKDYEELRMEEEEKRLSTERRQRETPSAVYAHKSVQVGASAVSRLQARELTRRPGNTAGLCHTSHRRPRQLCRRPPPRSLRAQRIRGPPLRPAVHQVCQASVREPVDPLAAWKQRRQRAHGTV